MTPKSEFRPRPFSKLVIRKPTYLSSCITPIQSDVGDQLVSRPTLPVTTQVAEASIKSDVGDQLVGRPTLPVTTQVAEAPIQPDVGDQLVSRPTLPVTTQVLVRRLKQSLNSRRNCKMQRM